MSNATIKLSGIGKSSRIFAHRLATAKIFVTDERGVPVVSETLSHLTVSFIGVGPTDTLRIEDLATLALVIRAVAEAGCSVVVELPKPYRGEPSRIYRFLERIGFCDLFTEIHSSSKWRKNVEVLGHDQHFSPSHFTETLEHYIPLQWFSVEEFALSESQNMWQVRPTIEPYLERQFRSLLQTHGLSDDDTIDLLTKTMFVELGWNAVLHSGSVAGSAIGAFCAQIHYWHDEKRRPLPPKLTFCIADIGRGIPNALRAPFHANTNRGGKYNLTQGFSENTAIVRYALDPDSTSRPEMPSNVDREGFRGLAFVASAIRGVGEMSIRSDGGAVTLAGQLTVSSGSTTATRGRR